MVILRGRVSLARKVPLTWDDEGIEDLFAA